MKSFLYIFILPIIILSFLLIFGLIKSNETDDLRKKLLKQQDSVNKIRSDQHLEELFSTDLNVALGEWESWSKVAKTCIKKHRVFYRVVANSMVFTRVILRNIR